MHFFQEILNDLNVKFTVSYAKSLFDSRGDSGSLYGIKKMLEKFDISSEGVHVTESNINILQYPLIYLDGVFKVAKQQPNKPSVLIGQVVLQITDRGKAAEPDYFSHIMKKTMYYGVKYIVAACIAILVACSFIESLSNYNNSVLINNQLFPYWVQKLILLLLNVVGIFFSYRTVANECSGSCHNVLSSSGSKLFGIYSLSVVGLSYFLSSSLIILFIPSLFPVYALIAAIAVLMPIWSISYQAFIVKSWCRNCLTVQAIVLLIFVAELLFDNITVSHLRLIKCMEAVSIYVIVFYVCEMFYEIVQKENRYPKDILLSYLELMKRPEIKDIIISSGKVYDTKNASRIIITNPEANRELFFIISPYCNYCKDTILKLIEMIDSKLLNDFKVTLLFAPDKKAIEIYGPVIYEYYKDGPSAAVDLLIEWYNNNAFNRFRKLYEKMEKTPEYFEEIDRQEHWYMENDIKSTPVMIVDSHEVSNILLEGLFDKKIV